MFANKEKVHLIGIGGIGMSGLAQLLLAFGLRISGSDLKPSLLIEKLKNLGAQIFIGHHSANIAGVDLVIYSAAIKQDNPELVAAYSAGIAVLSRAEALAILANQRKSIAITGAHGKTTTACLISHMLVKCNLKPSVCVGGELLSLEGNAYLGESHYFVLEADESDGSFLSLNPFYSVITNIDREHLDYYRDLEHIRETFRRFMNNLRAAGCLFCCQDDASLMEIAHSLDKRLFSYGLSPEAGIFAKDIQMREDKTYFSCIYQGESLGKVELNIPGQHNICNALAAIAVGCELGLDFPSIQNALGSYSGVKRRLQLKLKQRDILIFDDYAHHPTEIKATLAALKSFRHKRIVAIFQPHRYTRTRFLIDDFGRCFQGVDHLIVTDIYPASEAPLAGVSAKNICQKAQETDIKDIRFLSQKDILGHLLGEIRPGDLVAVMGAGDIGSIADALVEEVKRTHPL